MFHWAWKPQQFTHVTIHFYVVQNWFGPRYDSKDHNLYTALAYSLLFYNLHFTSYNIHFGSDTFIEMKTNIENGRKKMKNVSHGREKKDAWIIITKKILEMNPAHGQNLMCDWEHNKWEFSKKHRRFSLTTKYLWNVGICTRSQQSYDNIHVWPIHPINIGECICLYFVDMYIM